MLVGNSNEERIWNYLIGKGMSKAGAAGMMGNLYAESGMNPQNLQNGFDKKLGYTDASYTKAVDNGSYSNFARDSAGYGIAQWTYWTRKQNLLKFARAAGKSVGNLEMQLDFLLKELNDEYKAVLSVLRSATSVRTASDCVLLRFERPADQGSAVKAKRASYGQAYYNRYAGTTGNGGKVMTENALRQKVVDTARGYLGFKESDGSHKGIIDVYNSHKPLARNYRLKYTDPWCAGTVSAVSIVCELTDIMPTECSCDAMIALYKKLGRWVEDDNYKPKIADVAFYDWQDSGVGDCTGGSDHVGIVTAVNGNTLTITEGNKNDAVSNRTITVGARYIRGYGIPDYASKAAGGTTSASATTGTSTGAAASYEIGDTVTFSGTKHYASSGEAYGKYCKAGKAMITKIASGAKHPYHVVAVQGSGSTVYGWVDAADISGGSAATGSVDVVAQEVLDGKWGNGDDRKARLKAAGYDYDAVQKRVNELLND